MGKPVGACTYLTGNVTIQRHDAFGRDSKTETFVVGAYDVTSGTLSEATAETLLWMYQPQAAGVTEYQKAPGSKTTLDHFCFRPQPGVSLFASPAAYDYAVLTVLADSEANNVTPGVLKYLGELETVAKSFTAFALAPVDVADESVVLYLSSVKQSLSDFAAEARARARASMTMLSAAFSVDEALQIMAPLHLVQPDGPRYMNQEGGVSIGKTRSLKDFYVGLLPNVDPTTVTDARTSNLLNESDTASAYYDRLGELSGDTILTNILNASWHVRMFDEAVNSAKVESDNAKFLLDRAEKALLQIADPNTQGKKEDALKFLVEWSQTSLPNIITNQNRADMFKRVVEQLAEARGVKTEAPKASPVKAARKPATTKPKAAPKPSGFNLGNSFE